eukprot:Opistho-2@69485
MLRASLSVLAQTCIVTTERLLPAVQCQTLTQTRLLSQRRLPIVSRAMATMKAVSFSRTGPPSVLEYKDLPVPELADSNVLIKNAVVGVNYIDCYHRTGLYSVPLPYIPGREGAGTVVAVGKDVTQVKAGDRVTYFGPGAYAEMTSVPIARVAALPDAVSFEQACTSMVQGLTAQYLVNDSYAIKKGDTVLVHACAGGVGLILTQYAKLKGARVIGTCSTPEKATLAYAAGADNVILYTQQDFVAEVLRLTEEKGVQAVYDSVGLTTFEGSFKCLAVRGTIAIFGQSSGKVPPLELLTLAKGSYFLTRPVLDHFIPSRDEFVKRASEFFSLVESGQMKITVGKAFALADAAQAHTALEGRATVGKVLLKP